MEICHFHLLSDARTCLLVRQQPVHQCLEPVARGLSLLKTTTENHL